MDDEQKALIRSIARAVAIIAITVFVGIGYLGIDDLSRIDQMAWDMYPGQELTAPQLFRISALLKSVVGLLGVVASVVIYKVFY